MWMGQLGNGKSPEVGWGKIPSERQRDCGLPGDHLGQDDPSHLQEEWRGPCLSLSTAFTCPDSCPLLKFTPIPLPSLREYSSSTSSMPGPVLGDAGDHREWSELADLGPSPSQPRLIWTADIMLQFITSKNFWGKKMQPISSSLHQPCHNSDIF